MYKVANNRNSNRGNITLGLKYQSINIGVPSKESETTPSSKP
jgi:hypothetical protein